MKKNLKIGAAVTMSLALITFIFAACNEPGPPVDVGVGETVTLDFGGENGPFLPFEVGSDEWTGVAIGFEDFPVLSNIRSYTNVIVYAVFYADSAGLLPITESDWEAIDGYGFTQFRLLANRDGGFTGANLVSGNDAQSIAIRSGPTTMVVAADASGVPGALLIETSVPQIVQGVRIHSITFSSDPVALELAFGTALAVSGNTIIFNNAGNDGGAALYRFSPTELSALPNSIVRVSYTIIDPGFELLDPSTNEHQLSIRSAGEDGVALHDHYTNMWWPILYFPEGYFDLNGSLLLTRAGLGSFELIGFHIVNNGGPWTNAGVTYNRRFSYTITINSVTLVPAN